MSVKQMGFWFVVNKSYLRDGILGVFESSPPWTNAERMHSAGKIAYVPHIRLAALTSLSFACP